ncbi:hypothetical protein MDA_GLEAN10011541 [Myotis davidii]|uniref:Uncharacterized protein n=1 Tax=Myotis davidii TaxID=225400 RepID=L5LKA7_MYODS|nr:hypothetical protein MDA_GLEAN10011541 [Myotis davidii]
MVLLFTSGCRDWDSHMILMALEESGPFKPSSTLSLNAASKLQCFKSMCHSHPPTPSPRDSECRPSGISASSDPAEEAVNPSWLAAPASDPDPAILSSAVEKGQFRLAVSSGGGMGQVDCDTLSQVQDGEKGHMFAVHTRVPLTSRMREQPQGGRAGEE